MTDAECNGESVHHAAQSTVLAWRWTPSDQQDIKHWPDKFRKNLDKWLANELKWIYQLQRTVEDQAYYYQGYVKVHQKGGVRPAQLKSELEIFCKGLWYIERANKIGKRELKQYMLSGSEPLEGPWYDNSSTTKVLRRSSTTSVPQRGRKRVRLETGPDQVTTLSISDSDTDSDTAGPQPSSTTAEVQVKYRKTSQESKYSVPSNATSQSIVQLPSTAILASISKHQIVVPPKEPPLSDPSKPQTPEAGKEHVNDPSKPQTPEAGKDTDPSKPQFTRMLSGDMSRSEFLLAMVKGSAAVETVEDIEARISIRQKKIDDWDQKTIMERAETKTTLLAYEQSLLKIEEEKAKAYEATKKKRQELENKLKIALVAVVDS